MVCPVWHFYILAPFILTRVEAEEEGRTISTIRAFRLPVQNCLTWGSRRDGSEISLSFETLSCIASDGLKSDDCNNTYGASMGLSAIWLLSLLSR